MSYNDDKVKDLLENVEVPEEVSPENMKKMLDEKAPAKKRSSRISIAGRITAAAAACAVIVGATVGTTGLINRDKKGSVNCPEVSTEDKEHTTQNITIETPDAEVKGPYMNSAESYEQVYALVEKASESREKYIYGAKGDIYFETNGEIASDDIMKGEADNAVSAIPEEVPAVDGSINSENTQGDFVSGGMGGETEPEQQYIIQEEPATEAPTEQITENPTEAASEEVTESPVTEESTEQATEESTEAATEEATEDEDDYSDTYNQEENVLEADIVKTDGERIYYVYNYYDVNADYKYDRNQSAMRIAAVDDGEFTDTYTLDIEYDCGLGDEWEKNITVSDMYIYNDMLAVVGTSSSYRDSYTVYGYNYNGEYFYENEAVTFVSFYTKENEPQLIGTYTQDGRYNDVRIAPDGYMYLLTNYSTDDFDTIKDSDNLDGYIPKCGFDNPEYIPAESILLPEDDLDNYEYMSYTVIGSINLTVPGEFSACDTKALAGYSGDIYSSADNLYTMTTDYSDTDITRIAIGGGQIVPMASGTVEGVAKDQFSFSEYNGYLRVATTINEWRDNGNLIKDVLDIPSESYRVNHNNVYVLDMDMNIVGSVEGFGVDESIKSVSFSGNMGYVVTYEQTDPLFAIDLSDPANPFITDEFKILGYSTYMQKWDEGLLLGFGADADEYGVENGVKLVMFDNSDPYDLKEVGLYPIHNEGNSYIYSGALWERKALLIAPNKNLIGVPVTVETYSPEYHFTADSKYMFFSYEDGEFIFKGELSLGDISGYGGSRAVYIGDYVYAVSKGCFISADIETLTEVDSFYF